MPNPFALVFDPAGLVFSLLGRVGARNESPSPAPTFSGTGGRPSQSYVCPGIWKPDSSLVTRSAPG
jgi:hypothetical protein